MSIYYCPVCKKDEDCPYENKTLGDDEIIYECPDCGEEIVESYDCPIHGTAAPDGHGHCAKC